MKAYKSTVESIKSSSNDIKAEVLIADLIDKGIDTEKIFVIHEGLFARNYSRDVLDVYVDMMRDIIAFRIARDGLYDVLPEGLFHTITVLTAFDKESRKNEFKKQKQEEVNARKFFFPFDHELFYQKTRLEVEILNLIRDPLTIFKHLFNVGKSLPENYARKFLSFLPFTNEIKGDIELTAFCLSEILGKEISYSSYYLDKKFDCSGAMGGSFPKNSLLGEDFICSDYLNECTLIWKFLIISEDDHDISGYADLEKNFMKNLISRYCDFFVPIEIELEIEFICRAKRDFILEDITSGSGIKSKIQYPEIYLGYNSVI